MHKIFRITLSVLLLTLLTSFYLFFGPTGKGKETEIFVVPKFSENFDAAGELTKQGFVRNIWIAQKFIAGNTIEPGGYRLTKSMWVWQTAGTVKSKPSLLWVTIKGCLRREQTGEILQSILGWDQTKLDSWNSAYTALETDYSEGVYYPDTYLLPVDETGAEVAKRFIDRFNEKFAPYFRKFQDADIRWVTALKIASLIEREAGGPDDMKIISGIIWNRLDTGMRLQIDATMQYTKGKKPDGSWWGGIDLSEKTSDSPYNTYIYKGLPPTPICSPSLASIEAVLTPDETDCLYYLHDSKKQIHCAKTYAGHKENIRLYLQ
jgi:cell division protein YceG involved in septum cleavage